MSSPVITSYSIHYTKLYDETALGFGAGHQGVETEFEFELDVLQGLFQGLDRDLLALFLGDLVVVAPLVDAHLLAGQGEGVRRPVGGLLALAEDRITSYNVCYTKLLRNNDKFIDTFKSNA